MAAVRKRNDSSVIDQIGDDLLSWVSTIFTLKLYFLFHVIPPAEWNSKWLMWWEKYVYTEIELLPKIVS